MEEQFLPNRTLSQKRIRIIELLLITGVAFAPTIFVSVYSLFWGALTSKAQVGPVLVFYGLIYEIIALAVLFYVLFRQGRSARQIGLTFSWKDIPVSLVLFVIGYVVFYICYVAIYFGVYHVVGRALTPTDAPTYVSAGVSVGTLIFVIINPLYEELIARAYTIFEIKFLTGSNVAAVVVSVMLQTLYHLYQGIGPALALAALFFVLSVYFLKFARIVPVILAHLYFDLLALVYANQ
jgi:membrane protease YdiL (CAAX protease family)